MKKYIFGTIPLICALSIVSFAQTRQPSAPIRPFIVKTKQSVADLEKSLGNENKVTDLIGGEGMQFRVAVQHDEKKILPTLKFTTLRTMFITFSKVRRN